MNGSEFYYPTAFMLGALHSFEPGHGGTVLAAYFIGARRRLLDAVLLGLTVTLTHTFSVILLGVAVWIAAARYRLEITEPALSLAGGLLVLGVGFWMLVRWRTGACSHPGHGHHAREHDHGHPQPHGEGSVGSSLWQLVLMGIVGGIVPCPAGIALLLAAASAGHIAQGLGLAAVFSLGVGVVVVTVSIIVYKAASLTTRWVSASGRLIERLPLISSCLIIALGLWLSGTAVLDLTRGPI